MLLHGIEDILYGLSKGKIEVKWHHKLKYYKSGGIYTEAFAHMYEASFSTEKSLLMKQYFQETYKIFEEVLGAKFNDYKTNREKILSSLS